MLMSSVSGNLKMYEKWPFENAGFNASIFFQGIYLIIILPSFIALFSCLCEH